MRKNCSSDQERLLKLEAEGQEFAKNLRSLEQFVRTVKIGKNHWDLETCRRIWKGAICTRIFEEVRKEKPDGFENSFGIPVVSASDQKKLTKTKKGLFALFYCNNTLYRWYFSTFLSGVMLKKQMAV